MVVEVIRKLVRCTLQKFLDLPQDRQKQPTSGDQLFNSEEELHFKDDIIKSISLPIGQITGSVENLKISLLGKGFKDFGVKIEIGTVEVEVTQLPSREWKDRIEKLLDNAEQELVQGLYQKIMDSLFTNNRKTLFRKLFIRVISNLSLSIQHFRIKYNRKAPTQCEELTIFSIGFYNFVKLNKEDRERKEKKERKEEGQEVKECTEGQEGKEEKVGKEKQLFSFDKFLVTHNKKELITLERVSVEQKPVKQKSLGINLQIYCQNAEAKVTITHFSHIQSIISTFYEFADFKNKILFQTHNKQTKHTVMQQKIQRMIEDKDLKEVLKKVHRKYKRKQQEKENGVQKQVKMGDPSIEYSRMMEQPLEELKKYLLGGERQKIIKIFSNQIMNHDKDYRGLVSKWIKIQEDQQDSVQQLISYLNTLEFNQSTPLLILSLDINHIHLTIFEDDQQRHALQITTSLEFQVEEQEKIEGKQEEQEDKESGKNRRKKKEERRNKNRLEYSILKANMRDLQFSILGKQNSTTKACTVESENYKRRTFGKIHQVSFVSQQQERLSMFVARDKKVHLTIEGAQFDSSVREIASLITILQQWKSYKQEQSEFQYTEVPQEVRHRSLSKMWEDCRWSKTTIIVSTPALKINIRDGSRRSILLFVAQQNLIKIQDCILVSNLEIAAKFGLYFKNKQSDCFEPIIEPFFFTLQSYEDKFFHKKTVRISANDKQRDECELKINISAQLLITLHNFRKQLILFSGKEWQLKTIQLHNLFQQDLRIKFKREEEEGSDLIARNNYYSLNGIDSFCLGFKQKGPYSQWVDTRKLKQGQITHADSQKFKFLLHSSSPLIFNISPPFVINNCLPNPALVQFITYKNGSVTKKINPKDSHFSFTTEHIEHFGFKVRVQGYNWSKLIGFSHANDGLECELKLTDKYQHGITLNYNFKKDKHTEQYILNIYCKRYIELTEPYVAVYATLEETERKKRCADQYQLIGGSYQEWESKAASRANIQKQSQAVSGQPQEKQQCYDEDPNLNIVLIGSQVGSQIQITQLQQAGDLQDILKGDKLYSQPHNPIFIGALGTTQNLMYSYNSKYNRKKGEKEGKFKLVEVDISQEEMVRGCEIISKRIVVKTVKFKNELNSQITASSAQSNEDIRISNQEERPVHFQSNSIQARWSMSMLEQDEPTFLQFPHHQQCAKGVSLKRQSTPNTLTYRFHHPEEPEQEECVPKSKKPRFKKENTIEVNLSLITISIIHNSSQFVKPYESMVVTLKRVHLRRQQFQRENFYRFKVGNIQVDQMSPQDLPNPVILKTKAQNFLDATVSVSKRQQRTYNQVFISMSDLHLNLPVDSFNLIKTVSRELKISKQAQPMGDRNQTTIKRFVISPFVIHLTAAHELTHYNLDDNRLLTILMSSLCTLTTDANSIPIKIQGLNVTQCKSASIIQQLSVFYQSSLATQCYSIFRGIQNQGKRVNNFINESSKAEFIDERDDLIKIKLDYIQKLNKEQDKEKETEKQDNDKHYKDKGVLYFIQQNTDKISDRLATFTFDKDFEQLRDKNMRKKPKGALEGLQKGGKAFYTGIKQGVFGVFTQPYHGAKQGGFLGFIKGAGKGVAGLFIKPITGCCDCLSSTAEGFRDKGQLCRRERPKTKRYPRVFYTSCSVMREYSKKHSELFYILKKQYNQKKLTNPILVNAFEYSSNEFLAILHNSIAFVSLYSQKVICEIEYHELHMSQDEVERTLIFKRNHSKCCQNENKYELYVKDDKIRRDIYYVVKAQKSSK